MNGDPIDDTIVALVALWDGAPELAYEVDGEPAQLVVKDGPLLDDEQARRFLQVGTGGLYVLAGGQSTSAYGYDDRTDTVDIPSQLIVWSGDTDTAAVRRDAFEVVKALDGLLARDRNLGGAVDRAHLLRRQYMPMQDAGGQGCAARVELTVRAVATRYDEG